MAIMELNNYQHDEGPDNDPGDGPELDDGGNDDQGGDDNDHFHDIGERGEHDYGDKEYSLTGERSKGDYSLFDRGSDYDRFVHPEHEEKERERNDHFGMLEKTREYFNDKRADLDKMMNDSGMSNYEKTMAEYESNVIKCQQMNQQGPLSFFTDKLLKDIFGAETVLGAIGKDAAVTSTIAGGALKAEEIGTAIVEGGSLAAGVTALGAAGAVAVGVGALGLAGKTSEISKQYSDYQKGVEIKCRENTKLFNY